jgi:HlyD family secretion protein
MTKKSPQNASKVALAWMVWSVVLGAISFGGWQVYNRMLTSVSEPTPVRLFEVRKDTVEDIISESGIVEFGGQQTLEAPVEGTVVELSVKVGDPITPGQKLFLLEDPNQQISIAEHELKLQETQLELESSRQKVERDGKALSVAQQKLQADQKLFDRGFISEDELQNQKDVVGNAQATLAEAEKAVRQIMLQLQLLQLQSQKLKDELHKNLVTAPREGQVLEIKFQTGAVVERGDPLMIVGNPKQELVKLELSTLNASKVELNMPARISIIGPSSETFSGEVKSLSPIASIKEGRLGISNQATVSAIVELDNPSGQLIPGSQVSVDLILERHPDALVLPTQTIQRTEAQPFVWVQDEQGNAQKQPISLGMEGLTTTVITSGLQPGDQVILPLDNLPLEPGMPVRQ